MAKRRIRENAWGNWYGYEGTRRTEMFFNSSTMTAEQMARTWLNGGCVHDWQEQPGEPPRDVCSSCGEVRW